MSGYLVKVRGIGHPVMFVEDASHYAEKDLIKIPEGADKYIELSATNWAFYKDNFKEAWIRGEWIATEWNDINLKYWLDCKVLWERKYESSVDTKLDEEGSIVDGAKIPQHIIDSVTQPLSKVDETLNERQSQYGCFEDVAFATENIIGILKRCGYDDMPNPHKMAMYMIVSKMARLVNGDHNHIDGWHDIGGYAKLIENLIGGENE